MAKKQPAKKNPYKPGTDSYHSWINYNEPAKADSLALKWLKENPGKTAKDIVDYASPEIDWEKRLSKYQQKSTPMAKKQTATGFSKKPNAKTGRLEYSSVNRGNAKKTAMGSPLAKTKSPTLSGLKTKPNVLNPILTKKRK